MITFDNATNGGRSTTLTLAFSHVVGVGAAPMLIVGVWCNNINVPTCLVDGVPATLLTQVNPTGSPYPNLYIFYVYGPSAGSRAISITGGSVLYGIALSYLGVNSSPIPDSSNTGSTNSNTITVATTVVAVGSWLIGFGTAGGTTGTFLPFTTDRTQRISNTFAVDGIVAGDSNNNVAQTSQSMTFAYNPIASNIIYGAVFSLKPDFFPATVTTQAVSSIAAFSATTNGNITALGDTTPDERGFVIDLASHALPGNVAPASSGYAGAITQSGSFGTGAFTGALTGLSPGTTYYVRAYAHNTSVYAYGNEVSFTTPIILPTVTTQAMDLLSQVTARGNGNITNLGGDTSCDKRGIVYSTSSHSLPGNVAPGSSGYGSVVTETGTFITGAFIELLTGLSAMTTYYARAYCHNSAGYSYGAEVSFTTIPYGKGNFLIMF